MSKAHVILCSLLLLSCINCSKKPNSDKSKLEAQRQKAFLEFAANHHASPNWKTALPFQSVGTSFSLQLQDALTGPSREPIALRAYLHDVAGQGGRYQFVFSGFDDMVFWLEATPDQVSQVLKEAQLPGLDEYAVAAEIHGVRKVAFQVSAPDGGEPHLADVNASDKFVATGRCVALTRLPD